MIQVSDQTLAELLAKRLRELGVISFYVRELGPGDVVYASALRAAGDKTVREAERSGECAEDAILTLLSDLAIAAAAPTEDA